ncbi:Centrosomal of 120 kDa, partial [Paramuricea clavata]
VKLLTHLYLSCVTYILSNCKAFAQTLIFNNLRKQANACHLLIEDACFIQMKRNEVSHLIIYCLNCIRRDRNSTNKTGHRLFANQKELYNTVILYEKRFSRAPFISEIVGSIDLMHNDENFELFNFILFIILFYSCCGLVTPQESVNKSQKSCVFHRVLRFPRTGKVERVVLTIFNFRTILRDTKNHAVSYYSDTAIDQRKIRWFDEKLDSSMGRAACQNNMKQLCFVIRYNLDLGCNLFFKSAVELEPQEKEIANTERKELEDIKNELNRLKDQERSKQQDTVTQQQEHLHSQQEAAMLAAREREETQRKEELDSKIAKLIEERDTLLQTGVYTTEDRIISELDRQIREAIASKT